MGFIELHNVFYGCMRFIVIVDSDKSKRKTKDSNFYGIFVIYCCGSLMVFTDNLLIPVVTREYYITFCFVADTVVLFCLLCKNKTNVGWKKNSQVDYSG